MGRNQSSFGPPTGIAKSGLNSVRGRIFCSSMQHSNGHIWSFRYPNQVIQKPKLIYTSRYTTWMKSPSPKEIVFNTEILMEAGRRDLFLIWWETYLMGSPMLIRKSDGIGEILFTESNLLYFSQSLLSLRLLSRG